MDYLWPQERLLKIFSKSSIRLAVAHASGDGVLNRCCRLCGSENNLRCFCTSYMCEGVEERYDQMLFNSFGIRVSPPDCLVCENCIRQLRNINRFRSLVLAAFARASSEYSTRLSQKSGKGSQKAKIKGKKSSISEYLKNDSKAYVKRASSKKSSLNTNVQLKRTNVACSMCKQRYPMLLPTKTSKIFVCSRCKKKSAPRNTICRKCNIILPANKLREHLENHTRNEMKRKSRLSLGSRNLNQGRTESHFPQLHQHYCAECPKKYALAQHLATHIQREHKKQPEYLCAVCGKDLKSREMLDRHMRTHTGQPIYQCDVCLRYFKGKQSFQTHYLSHGK
ncbi:zinc finger protein 432 [Pieris rapae]|uniref:zinc finger protein 432 n=1 Tax=Pieris rapae TaxID=64459 RepID=UPI001E28085B|nr:zinc finger protein 432 [Pieris rapae]